MRASTIEQRRRLYLLARVVIARHYRQPLTLDEVALWLNLANVYWSPQGRESIDAVILFGSLLAIGTWGAPLFSAIMRKK